MNSKILMLGGYAMATKSIIDGMNRIRSENQRKLRRIRTTNLIIGVSIGTALGATAGVLFAPRPGRETRENISQKAAETIDNIKENVITAKNKVSENIKEKSSKLQDSADKAAKKVEDTAKKG